VIVGQTLQTTCVDMYRALLESTAFGTRIIVETFVASGVPVTELVVAGGLLKNRLLMQIYADVVGLPLSTVPSGQAPALGSAIHAATAAGAYPDVRAAAGRMGRRTRQAYQPNPENVALYDQLYSEYVTLYDWFGRGNDMMRRLRRIRAHETVGALR
jgi:L-ribulokinase